MSFRRALGKAFVREQFTKVMRAVEYDGWKVGDFVRPKRNHQGFRGDAVVVARKYIVNAVLRHGAGTYLRILGDDLRGYDLLASLFEPV